LGFGVIHELQSYGVEVFVTDPQAEAEEALHEYNVKLLLWDDLPRADAVVAAVSHDEFLSIGPAELAQKLVKGGAFIDVKAAFDESALTAAGYRVWRL
jgi:UDP-N-acetyl-D-galactosamine dehydrogenase